MPDFTYKAVDKGGKSIEGSMAADNEVMLDQQLQAIGYWMIEAQLSSKAAAPKRFKVTRKELIEFCSAMSAMLGSGISIIDAFETMTEQSSNPGFLHVLEDVSLNVQAGNPISESMSLYPTVFPVQMCNLIKAAEVSGNLPEAFKDLQLHLEWVDRMVSDVKQVSIYPAIVVCVVILFILLLFSFVVPTFTKILVSLNVPLPAITQVVIATGDVIKQYWWAIVGTPVAAFIGLRYLARASDVVALRLDHVKLGLPIFGDIARMIALSQFAHNMSVLVRSGVTILQSLTLCKDMIGNRVVAAAIQDAENAVNEGKTVSSALREHRIFPPMMLRMITVGEESGQFEHALAHVSARFDEEIPIRVKRVFAIVEPVIMLTLIGIVGMVALAIFLPLISVMGSVG
ncbi:MAG: type II secretion system F family protein [Pseudomonadota bacterium]